MMTMMVPWPLPLPDSPEEAGKNLRKFIPYDQEFEAITYSSIFDREFFRVIETPGEGLD